MPTIPRAQRTVQNEIGAPPTSSLKMTPTAVDYSGFAKGVEEAERHLYGMAFAAKKDTDAAMSNKAKAEIGALTSDMLNNPQTGFLNRKGEHAFGNVDDDGNPSKDGLTAASDYYTAEYKRRTDAIMAGLTGDQAAEVAPYLNTHSLDFKLNIQRHVTGENEKFKIASSNALVVENRNMVSRVNPNAPDAQNMINAAIMSSRKAIADSPTSRGMPGEAIAEAQLKEESHLLASAVLGRIALDDGIGARKFLDMPLGGGVVVRDRLTAEDRLKVENALRPQLAKQVGMTAGQDAFSQFPNPADMDKGIAYLAEKFKDDPEAYTVAETTYRQRVTVTTQARKQREEDSKNAIEQRIATLRTQNKGIPITENDVFSPKEWLDFEANAPGLRMAYQEKIRTINEQIRKDGTEDAMDTIYEHLLSLRATGKTQFEDADIPQEMINSLMAVTGGSEAAYKLLAQIRKDAAEISDKKRTMIWEARREAKWQRENGTEAQFDRYDSLMTDDSALMKINPSEEYNRGAVTEWQANQLTKKRDAVIARKKDLRVASAQERGHLTKFATANRIGKKDMAAFETAYMKIREGIVNETGEAPKDPAEWDRIAGFVISDVAVKGGMPKIFGGNTRRMYQVVPGRYVQEIPKDVMPDIDKALQAAGKKVTDENRTWLWNQYQFKQYQGATE